MFYLFIFIFSCFPLTKNAIYTTYILHYSLIPLLPSDTYDISNDSILSRLDFGAKACQILIVAAENDSGNNAA